MADRRLQRQSQGRADGGRDLDPRRWYDRSARPAEGQHASRARCSRDRYRGARACCRARRAPSGRSVDVDHHLALRAGPATSAVAFAVARIGTLATVSFALVDAPRDRPDFLRETVDLLTGELDGHRARLLARVEATSDEALVEGSDDDWSVGMVAYHLLVSERGMMGIVMRLARGEVPTSTGQPRPVVGSATRQVIAEAAAKAASAVQRVRAEFP